ncbi:MAG: aldehyde ferredoxin oxidoreductase family protein [Anaerolineales bacterium]|nr:aldehyde ferredoxin oxidoreductase family protein [Anaerolineales bacterium]
MAKKLAGGYQGKILKIDLSTGKNESIDTDPDMAEKYIGGVGFGNYFLWNLLDAGVDPLGPENVLMFMAGPMTGTGVSGSRWGGIYKSPHTGAWARTLMGGDIGPELKHAGWDGMIITGKADKPVYLYIKDDEVEIRDAQALWGLDTHQTTLKLEQEIGDRLVRSMCIGPAGENLVKFACISSEYFRAMGRTGGGAVMGSKNLKAVAVRGTKAITVANLEKFWELVKRQRKELKSPDNFFFRRWGTVSYGEFINDTGALGVKNFQATNLNEQEFSAFSSQFYERTLEISRRSCVGCANHCMSMGLVRTGKFAGVVGELDYEGITNLGTGCGQYDLRKIVPAVTEAERLGLDLISCGKAVSFAMECYEKGILTESDLGGLDLTWGNTEAQLALMNKIALRQDIGDVLAEGCWRAAQKIGGGAEEYAMVAGLKHEISGSDPRSQDWAFYSSYVTSERGSCHNSPAGVLDAPDVAKQNLWPLFNSLVLCAFVSIDGWGAVLPVIPDYMEINNAITGWNLEAEEFLQKGERILNLAHCFNIREGFRRNDWEYLPNRAFEPIPFGPHEGESLSREAVASFFDQYYTLRGWDPTTSIPTRAKLEELDLKFAADELKL